MITSRQMSPRFVWNYSGTHLTGPGNDNSVTNAQKFVLGNNPPCDPYATTTETASAEFIAQRNCSPDAFPCATGLRHSGADNTMFLPPIKHECSVHVHFHRKPALMRPSGFWLRTFGIHNAVCLLCSKVAFLGHGRHNASTIQNVLRERQPCAVVPPARERFSARRASQFREYSSTMSLSLCLSLSLECFRALCFYELSHV